MIAALYVDERGCYAGLPDVEVWGVTRDARLYAGPWPIVAHPPCNSWCQLAPVNEARYGHRVGDDGGCFAAALEAVRRWGGVLEHPALSLAWRAFGLVEPMKHGWIRWGDSWTCQVAQRNYGHRARKWTWLHAVGVDPPSLTWGPGPAPEAWISADRPRVQLAAAGVAQLSKREAKATPIPFRDLLLSIARTARLERSA